MTTTKLKLDSQKNVVTDDFAELLLAVGQAVRQRRLAKGWSLTVLADNAGVSSGLLSQLERGIANPAFSTLQKIAHSLGVHIAQLLEVEPSTSPVVRFHERVALTRARKKWGEKAKFELLSSPVASLEVLQITAEPGYTTEETPFSHIGEEFGLILSGVHQVWLNGQCHELHPGDSISYSSLVPHWFKNPGPSRVVALWVTSTNPSGVEAGLSGAGAIRRI